MEPTKKKKIVILDAPQTDEELRALKLEKFKRDAQHPNQFTNWFPVVQSLDYFGVKYPKTKVVELPLSVTELVYQEDPVAFARDPIVIGIVEQVESAFSAWGVDSLFMKNSLFSAKHGWKNTCHVTKDSDISLQLFSIQYEWLCCGIHTATHVVIREMIQLEPLFYAFNGMPITQEFRLFCKSGLGVYAYQPYWPEKAIKDPSTPDFANKLRGVKAPSQKLLQLMIDQAEKVVGTLGGDWSIDFLIDHEGFPWLIDMALSLTSYKSDDRIILKKEYFL